MLTLLGGVAGLCMAPGSASAQDCNAAVAAGFLTTCPQPRSSYFDSRQDYRRSHGDNDFHDNRGYENGGYQDHRGSGNQGGMGHGGEGHGR
jgi:hypothetical protein